MELAGTNTVAGSPFCAICITRRATTTDEIDGRRVVVCHACRDEAVPDPPPPPQTGERLLRLLKRSDGLGITELAMALDEDSELGRAKLSAALARCVRAGTVYFTGGWNDRVYHAVPRAKPPVA